MINIEKLKKQFNIKDNEIKIIIEEMYKIGYLEYQLFNKIKNNKKWKKQ